MNFFFPSSYLYGPRQPRTVELLPFTTCSHVRPNILFSCLMKPEKEPEKEPENEPAQPSLSIGPTEKPGRGG